jgi:hypothetical protein
MIVCCVLAAMIASPLNGAVAEIASASPPLNSDGLLQLVQRHYSAQPIEQEQSTIGALLQAWNATRQRPDVDVVDLEGVLGARRDAIATLDVVYHASLFIDPQAAGPLRANMQVGGSRTWWGRWTRTTTAVRRLAAPDLRTLIDEAPAESLVAAGCDGRGTWSLRGDGVLALPVSVACEGGYVLGLEGPWAGTGLLASRADMGLAVVPSHDLAHELESLPAGSAVVEFDGVLIRLRVGWTSPLFVWFDPAQQWTIVRVVRRWWEGDVELELETTPSAWVSTVAQVQVPSRVRVVQRIRGAQHRPMMELSLLAISLQAGEVVDPSLVWPP